MTRSQVNKALYVLSILALLTLVIILHNMHYDFGFLIDGIKTKPLLVLFTYAYLLAMIIAPFMKLNYVLLLAPIDSLVNLPSALYVLFLAFTGKTTLASFGVISGYINPILVLLLDISGLTILVLRLWKYVQEKRLSGSSRF